MLAGHRAQAKEQEQQQHRSCRVALGFLSAAKGIVGGHGGDPAPNLALSLSTHQSTGFIHNIYTPTETCAYHPEAGGSEKTQPGDPGMLSAPSSRNTQAPDGTRLPGACSAGGNRGAGRVRLTLSLPAFPRRVLPGRTSFLLPSALPPPRRSRSPLFVLSVPPRPDPSFAAVTCALPAGLGMCGCARGRAPPGAPPRAEPLARPGPSSRVPDAPEVTEGPRGQPRGDRPALPRHSKDDGPALPPAAPPPRQPARPPAPPGGST